MTEQAQRPALRELLPNLIAFALGLGAAWFLSWNTTDLVWSLWLSSLVVGYLTILSTIGSGVLVGILALRHEALSPKKRIAAIVGGTLFALFILAFFSIHFCGFHAAHATFLSGFFPIEGMDDRAFMDTFVNPFRLWGIALTQLFPLYGIFLVAAIVVERDHLVDPIRHVLTSKNPDDTRDAYKDLLKKEGKKHKRASEHPMARPYINVVRMHILIFFFAGVHFLKIDSFFTYAVVYAVYFFPWKLIVRGR